MFNKALYQEHLAEKMEQICGVLQSHNKDMVIIPSGVPKGVYWDDNYYPYKPNFHFSLFVPENNFPHSYLLIRPEAKPQLIFYQPADYWHVVPESPNSDWADSFEVITVTDRNKWLELIPKQLSTAVWLGEQQSEIAALMAEENINAEDIVAELHFLRAAKNDYEVDCLLQANIKAAKGHNAARDAFLAGATEFEIHLAYLKATQHAEQELPYGNIIALGSHGAVLHYTELDRQLPAKDQRHSFLIDAGATAYNYCADITRTWSTDELFNNMIQAFDELELGLVAEVKTGADYVAMHRLAHLKISQFMVDHEILNCSAEEAVEKRLSSTFFPHGLGHLLGLQVHDIGGHQQDKTGTIVKPPAEHPFLRLTRTLETGYCVTIEPGMYFIDLLMNELKTKPEANLVNWSMVERLKSFGGIRIEDDVVATEDGHINLSRLAFEQLNKAN